MENNIKKRWDRHYGYSISYWVDLEKPVVVFDSGLNEVVKYDELPADYQYLVDRVIDESEEDYNNVIRLGCKFYECYNIKEIQYIGEYKFIGRSGIFIDYVNHFKEMKMQATIEKNAGKRSIAKLFLNSLYGKFGASNDKFVKRPCIPVAAFVTAYARRFIQNLFIKNVDRCCYCDTDSIHLIGDEPPEGVDLEKPVVVFDSGLNEVVKYDELPADYQYLVDRVIDESEEDYNNVIRLGCKFYECFNYQRFSILREIESFDETIYNINEV